MEQQQIVTGTPPESASAAPTPPRRRTRVLVVDDDPIVATGFRRLEASPQHPFRYEFAESCAKAVDALLLDPPTLVLADYMLGDGHGTDLVGQAIGIPVVIMTGYGSEHVAAEALRAGVSDYLIKDGSGGFLDLVAPTLERVLQRKRAELAERQRMEELAQTRRENRALEHFASILGSALATSLENVVAHVEELLTERAVSGDDSARSHADAALHNAARAREHVAQILDYARLMTESASRKDVDSALVLRDACGEFATVFEGGTVRLVVDPLPIVTVHPKALRMLWTGFVRRALRRRASTITVSANRAPPGWEFAIADDGSHSTDDDSVTMAIARRVLERHGGALRVESPAKGGSAVVFTLPE